MKWSDVKDGNQALIKLRSDIFKVVGISLMVMTILWAVKTCLFIRSAQSAAGEVIELRAGGAHPDIQFTTRDKRVIQYSQNGMIWGYRVGDQVRVLYNPDNPHEATLDDIGALWGFHVMIFGMGLIFF